MLKQYGKSCLDIVNVKRNMIEENDDYLARVNRTRLIYLEQPLRKKCKICEKTIEENNLRSFTSHGITYYICNKCGHVNGQCEETSDFTKRLYMDGSESNNAVYYKESSVERYHNRISNIYLPKAEFLKECLDQGGDSSSLSILDVGAGSGYFVYALDKLGFTAHGIEISNEQVEYGNKMIGKNLIECLNEKEVTERIKRTTDQVVTFIGVLEHVLNLSEILEAVKENESIKYMFFSVPCFSMSVMWEAISPEIYNRHLGNGHTHMFTKDSLEYIYKKYGFKVEGQWNFGTDMLDLYRMVYVKLIKNGNEDLGEILKERFLPVLDEMQLILDKNELFSEAHVLVKKII